MVRKAIVLAAGKGTRLLPLTLALPKEMIRVGVNPVIEHAIRVLKAGNIKDILIVVGRKKNAIMDYLGSGERHGLNIYYRIQEEPKGTAHAVLSGKDFIDSEDFAVIYGDNYLQPYNVTKSIIEFHESKNADATIVVHPVKDPRRYGIVKMKNDGRVLGIIEKPSLKEAEPYKIDGYYLNIAGLMVLNNLVFDFIEQIKPGKSNELWLTDSIELMRRKGCDVFGYRFEGTRFDVGTFESLREADEMEQRRREKICQN